MNIDSNVFVEKYRPKKFNDIVLDSTNKTILLNIIKTKYFPNLLLYGPPGTGKTTTIINLIDTYQELMNEKNKELVIHLNASDERGIDIIRSQINQFVNSNSLFNKGMKFVILDEVDYMTKTAQQALKYLLQQNNSNVRYCLICNYISKIDEGLQNEFLRLRFNQLPKEDILKFLEKISKKEGLEINNKMLESIQSLYKSDMRSMINFMQTNQNLKNYKINIIDDTIYDDLYNTLKSPHYKLSEIIDKVLNIEINYNIDKKNIIKNILNYIIRNKPYSNKLLDFMEDIIHYEDNSKYLINYFVLELVTLLRDSP
jgi:DNA polymerase III delta prime subunit